MPSSPFSPVELSYLRIAAIEYKIKKKLSSSKTLADRAGLTTSRHDLPKFLCGDTEYFEQVDKLAMFLKREGYWPPSRLKNFYYGAFSDFFRCETYDRIEEKIGHIVGQYEYYQWSSTHAGMVTVSAFTIESNGDAPYPHSYTVIERQHDNHSRKDRDESYEGCCFSGYRSIIFIMREHETRHPKFILLNKIGDKKRMYGLLLKVSTRKSLHISNVYLRKLDAGEEASPRIDYASNIEEYIMKRLEEPLTFLDLTEADKRYSMLSELLKSNISPFIKTDGG